MDLLSFVRSMGKQTKFKDSQYIIKEAFVLNNIQYYQFDDIFNLPYQRGMTALAFYEECRMGVDRAYLEQHTKAVDELLGAYKINIYKINALNQQLKERTEFFTDSDLLYKLASVVFFDSKENPKKYEQDYNERKIKAWKESNTADFFLQKPLQDLIPFLRHSRADLEACFRVARAVRGL